MSNPDDGVRVITQFLDALSVLDIETAVSLFAEDAQMDLPFSPPGMVKRNDGRSGIRESFSFLPQMVTPMNLENRRITPTSEDNDFIAEYTADCTVVPTGLPYKQKYISRFSVVNGEITYFAEYWDPIVLLVAFGATIPVPEWA